MVTRRTATALLLAGAAAPAFAAARTAPAIKVPTRGFNLPDWLAADPRVPSDAVLAKLRETGFETIRLPLDPNLVTTGFLPRLAQVLATVTGHGFNAILDVHAGSAFDPERVATAWQLIAPALADTPPELVYPELLNEPPLEPAVWHDLRDRLAETVRTRAPDHTLIWGPARFQGIWELDGSVPLADDNAIVAIHYYTPMGFTHQCENWDDTPLARIGNLPFPATRTSPEVVAVAATLDPSDRTFLDDEFQEPWTTEHIAADFRLAATWARAHHVPLMLGEFGVLDFCVDPVSRGNWVRAVRTAAETHGMGWAYWELDQGFGFIADRASEDGFDRPMIEALLA